MRATFLLGPAGSGKTFRCLAEIRAELLRSPEGPPLLLLAPRQSTFQLERQLLEDSSLAGYSRLLIFSFDRLARFVLESVHEAPVRLLSEEGRLMLLRALLASKQADLKLFHATARLPGFARQLSAVLREMQQAGVSPGRLDSIGHAGGLNRELADKVADLALLHRGYLERLEVHHLHDADCLIDMAVVALRSALPHSGIGSTQGDSAAASLRLSGLWLDGFAEVTPQELDLLTALLPCCDRATLAFCLDPSAKHADAPVSPWRVVRQTVQRCHDRISALPGFETEEVRLGGESAPGRFAENPVLAHLERHWANPIPFRSDVTLGEPVSQTIQVVECSDPEAEAVHAAREILRFVRDKGARFRDAAVLVRDLEVYHGALRRAFLRYEIPFFMDRRESVAHHPMVELTRTALRVAAFGWEHVDFFGALKTGLVHHDPNRIDELENEALARGWRGQMWEQPLPDAGIPGGPSLQLEALRKQLVQGFSDLAGGLVGQGTCDVPVPSGSQIRIALSRAWESWGVEDKLNDWGREVLGDVNPAIHDSVWDQMNDWVENLERAFGDDSMPLRAWMPILEAGLGNLTVGVIPPALDQVVIGSIDRSRNSGLRLALILGMNESVFPAPPPLESLINESERRDLEACGAALGPDSRTWLNRERYFGYIACTRSREKLVFTYSTRALDGGVLNPSQLLEPFSRLFPSLEHLQVSDSPPWTGAEHVSDLVIPLLRQRDSGPVVPGWDTIAESSALARLRETLPPLTVAGEDEGLSPAVAGSLYGTALRTSVSGLERFAECPFKFFVHSGLRAMERQRFDLDRRELGSFQHEVLRQFHEDLKAAGLRWHGLDTDEGRRRIEDAAGKVAPTFQSGLLLATEANRFLYRHHVATLQEFISVLLRWMSQYDFEPEAVELGFGRSDGGLPAWKVDLGGGRAVAFNGKIDRVDLCRDPATGQALCVVVDYKSGNRKLDDALMANGVQIQLPAYLNVLRRLPEAAALFQVSSIVPAGVFFVRLGGQFKSGSTRSEVLAAPGEDLRAAFQHLGRFDQSVRPRLDNRNVSRGDQFNYEIKKDGTFSKKRKDPLPREEFVSVLDRIEELLIQAGRRIFAGDAGVDPYRHKNKVPCSNCDYRAICRIDPWTHPYRALLPTARKPDPDEGAE
jgi:ATP-dependent helicase/nuclease subunit B